MTNKLSASLLVLAAVHPAVVSQPTAYSHTGTQAGERFGSAVCFTGDLDGDGRDDMAIGAPLHSGAAGPTGMVEVRSATGAVLYQLLGEAVGDQFGAALAGLDDVDGDEVGDLVVGAFSNGEGGPAAGKVYVVSGATGALIWSVTGNPGDKLGFSVAKAGDTDGDGITDVIAGAPDAQSAAGAAYVWRGSDGMLLLSFLGSAPGERLGQAVAGAGHVSPDQRDDVILGVPFAAPGGHVDAGRVEVRAGGSGVLLASLSHGEDGALFGFSVAGAGDLDGDGSDDVLAGSPLASPPGGSAAGRAFLHTSSGWGILSAWDGQAPGENLGRSVISTGDRDGDGIPDIAIGGPRSPGPLGATQGRILLVSGQTRHQLRVLRGTEGNQELGMALAGGGDLNLDGHADLIAGAPRHDTASLVDAGLVALYPAEGAVTYGTGVAPGNAMTLSFAGSFAPGMPFMVTAAMGPPSASGWIGASTGRATILWSTPGTHLVQLIDADPAISFLFPATYDATGTFTFNAWTRPEGFLNGRTFHLQAIAFAPQTNAATVSNGLTVTFGY